MDQIATFHTHFGALSFHKKLKSLGDQPVMMPVPRTLSASCGTCVKFSLEFFPQTMAHEDLDRVYTVEPDGYHECFYNEES